MTDLAVQRLAAAITPLTPRLALRDMVGVTRRNLLRIVRTPQLLFMSIVQPTIILLLFRYVLGGSIKIPGVDYVDYIVPGIFLEAVLIGGMTTALALAQDLQAGMIDRFRSLPMARSAFLAGRTLADLCRSVFALAFIIGLGLLVGFRFHNSVGRLPGRRRPDHLLRVLLHLGLRIGRSGREGSPDGPDGRHPPDVRALLRQLGGRSRGHHARLAATLCPEPAGSPWSSTRSGRSSRAGRSTTSCGRRSPGARPSSWSSSSCR